jgi:hypothetical protein
MKTQLLSKVILLGALLILTSAGSATAQSLSNRPKFDIPFDFAFGETKLPAGKYTVGRALNSSDDLSISISDSAGRSKAIVLSQAVTKSQRESRASLVFHRYGDQYFLVQVFPAGGATGRQLRESRLERKVQKHLTSNPIKRKTAETIIIAAAVQ